MRFGEVWLNNADGRGGQWRGELQNSGLLKMVSDAIAMVGAATNLATVCLLATVNAPLNAPKSETGPTVLLATAL